MSIASPLIGSFLQSKASKKAAKIQAKSAEQGADALVEATRLATAEYRRQYEVSRADLAPFREIGLESLETLSDLNAPGGELAEEFEEEFPEFAFEFEAEPGYQFRLSEGAKLLERSASARGTLLSGGQLKDISRFGQGIASDEYGRAYGRATDAYGRAIGARRQRFNEFQVGQGNRFSRLSALAGIGQTATTTLAQVGQQTAGNIGTATLTGGAAQRSGLIGAGNARAAGVIGSANAWARGIDESAVRAKAAFDQYFPYSGGGGGLGGLFGGGG